MKLNRGVVLIAFCAITIAGSAHAGLLGHTVQCALSFPSLCRGTATVSEGPEFTVTIGIRPAPIDVLSADFDDAGLTLTNIYAFGTVYLGSGTFPLQDFAFQDLTDPLVMATLVSSDVAGFTSSDITLSSGVLTLYLGDTVWDAGASIRVGLVTESQQVPEPATLALLGLGLAVVALARRRPSH